MKKSSFKRNILLYSVSLGCMVCASTVMGGDFGINKALAADVIKLQDSYVSPEYVEIERLRDTKEIIVITKKEIEGKGYSTITEVLKDVPSISANSTGLGDIDIRGQGSDQSTRNIQVLIDGAPITTLVNHPLSSNYDVVPVEQIEKIEIIPGGGSVLYGSGASGGIINITTNLRSLSKSQNSVTTEWNSDGYRLNLNYGEKINDKLTAEFGYSKLDRDLYFPNTYRNSEYFSGGLRYDMGKGEQLTFRASHLDEESQFVENVTTSKLAAAGKDYLPDYKTYTVGLDAEGHKITETRRAYLYGNRDMDSYNVSYQKKLSDTWKFSGDFFSNTGYFMNSQYDYMKMEHDTKGARIKLDKTYNGENNFLIGADIYSQEANLDYNDYKLVNSAKKTYKLLPLSFNYNKETTAVYFLNNIKHGKYTYTQGVRREKTDWNYDKTGNNINGDGTSERWNTAAELSMAYHYNDTGRVYARWERGYTSPDGLQITDEVRIDGIKKYVGTSAEDEKFDLYEIGLRDKVGISTVNLTLFSSNTDNQMNRIYYYDANNYLIMKTLNLLKTKRQGAELSFRQKLGKLTLEEAYAYLHGYSDYNESGNKFLEEYDKTAIDWTRSGLKKVPKHKATLKTNYSFDDKFSAGVTYTYFGSYNNFLDDAEAADGGIMKSHALVDLDMKYKLKKDMELYGGVTNIFNKTYYEYAGDSFGTLIPGSDRTYYMGIKYKF